MDRRPRNGDLESTLRKARIGVVLLVGISAGLVTLWAGTAAVVTATAIVGGFLVGAVLAYFVVPGAEEVDPYSDRGRRR